MRGVVRAIDVVEQALKTFGPPIYVRHEIVHNKFVVADLRDRGVIFVDELDQVPAGAIVIFSAHGVAKAVCYEAVNRGLKVIDATCPLVTKVHHQIEKFCHAGYEIVLVGHAGHPEVVGTMGQVDGDHRWRVYLVERVDDVATIKVHNPDMIAYVTQTTLSIDDTKEIINALKVRFPKIATSATEDICYATQNRQDAVRALVTDCDVILVIGSKTSSNSNSLRMLAEKCGTPAYLIDGSEDIHLDWLQDKKCIGVTAGASTPEFLVQGVIEQLKQWGAGDAHELKVHEENITFRVPRLGAQKLAVNSFPD